jgi:hypothetical protein
LQERQLLKRQRHADEDIQLKRSDGPEDKDEAPGAVEAKAVKRNHRKRQQEE